jgi:hypothetical protein
MDIDDRGIELAALDKCTWGGADTSLSHCIILQLDLRNALEPVNRVRTQVLMLLVPMPCLAS